MTDILALDLATTAVEALTSALTAVRCAVRCAVRADGERWWLLDRPEYGPGTPYDPNKPDDAQSTDCGHTYQHDGGRTVLTTIEWTVSWTSTDGTGGTLPSVRRSTQFPVTVEQRQAVITG